MNWVDVPSDILRQNINLLNNKLTFGEWVNIIGNTFPTVYFQENVYQTIFQHLKSKNVELGGVLIGSFYVDANNNVKIIEIKDSIPSEKYNSTGVSLEMNSDIWNKVAKITNNIDVVVGWYHSHPNLGVFFSSTDKYTQRHFFNNDYSVGLVVDPIRNEEKYFLGKNSELIPPQRITKIKI